jgi:signal transduction histidine kinase
MNDAGQAGRGALRILLIEDNPADARLTAELLREVGAAGINLVHAETLAAGIALLADDRGFAVVLADLSLPDAQGSETVCRLRESDPRVPLIVLTSLDDERTAVEMLQNGAQDYLVKGHGDGHVIARAIQYAIERKRSELQLTEAKEEAEAANLAKTTFLAHMSHELRTPLNAIIGFSDIIAGGMLGPDSWDVAREYARYINSSGRHLLKLVNDILDLSKSLAGQWDLHDELVDLPVLLRSCVDLVTVQAAQKEVAIGVTAPDDVPVLKADETRLKQAMLNLLSNAVKFSRNDGRVEVVLRRIADGDLEIAVRDHGVGMRPEEIPIALEPFRQLKNVEAGQEGTGLGLPLAKMIIEKHGGTLALESAAGAGTTAIVTLPGWRYARSDDDALRRSA